MSTDVVCAKSKATQVIDRLSISDHCTKVLQGRACVSLAPGLKLEHGTDPIFKVCHSGHWVLNVAVLLRRAADALSLPKEDVTATCDAGHTDSPVLCMSMELAWLLMLQGRPALVLHALSDTRPGPQCRGHW